MEAKENSRNTEKAYCEEGEVTPEEVALCMFHSGFYGYIPDTVTMPLLFDKVLLDENEEKRAKSMKSLLLNVEEGKLSEVDPQKTEDICRLIGCRIYTKVNLAINGRYYDFLCDDEALFVDDPKISAIDENGQPMLCGNVIISGEAQYGKQTDLTELDMDHIKKHIHKVGTRLHPEGLLMICQVQS